MPKLPAHLIWLVIVATLFFQAISAFSTTPATSKVAKITSVQISSATGLTRFAFEINGGSFHYQWQLSADKRYLTIQVDNTALATTEPKSSLFSTPIKDYQVKPLSNKSGVQLQFELKTALNPRIYTVPPSKDLGPRLLIDFGSTLIRTATYKPILDEPKSIKVNKPIPQIEPAQQQPPIKPSLVPLGKSFNRPITVVIDPGHGGKDAGAVGPANTREKDVVLGISKLLQHSFNKQPGFQAQLTRNQDIFIPLRERLNIARRYKADIFIAIHADAAYKNQEAVGASVFALSERGATSEMARWLARKENESELIYGVVVNKDQVLRSVLLDLSQTHTIAVSLEIGQEILKKLSNITKLHYKRVEQAAFVVLKSPDIPSLLIETGYVSNPIQEQKLKDPVYQQQLANTIVQGVVAYFAQHPPGKDFITT